MNARLLYKSRHPPTLEAVREVRHALAPLLNSYTPTPRVLQRIELVLAEAFTNLVKHAAARPSRIEVQIRIDPQFLWVELIDDGGHWNPLQSAAALPATFELKEAGLGVALMLSQSDRQHYVRDHGANRLSLGWERWSRPRILLVDDDASQLRLLSAYLSDEFDTLTAASAEAALVLLRKEQISLVLSDIQMPDMNGFELREQCQQLQHKAHIPFLLLTGQDSESHIAKASTLGVDEYLTKPVQKHQLIYTLRRVLERTRQLSQRLQERLDHEITRALNWNLPTEHPHWRLASFSKNSGRGGGDFLIQHRHGDSLFIALADTMGHDEGAKFFSHAFAGYLRGFISASAGLLRPQTLMEQLSQAAWQDQLFCHTTLSCCTVALLPAGALEITTAGHPAPLLVEPGAIRPIDVAGILPGLLPDAHYDSRALTLHSGQRLALYTDGLFDSAATPEGRKQLEAAINHALEQTAALPIQHALARVESVFEQHAGLLPKDDASLILLEPNLG